MIDKNNWHEGNNTNLKQNCNTLHLIVKSYKKIIVAFNALSLY
jgi:hypothetical protein